MSRDIFHALSERHFKYSFIWHDRENMALLRPLNGRYQTKVFHINRNINYVVQNLWHWSIPCNIYVQNKQITDNSVLLYSVFVVFGMSRMFSVSQICLLGLCATQLLFCNECCVDCELTAVTLVKRSIAPIYAELESGQERIVFHFSRLERPWFKQNQLVSVTLVYN